MDYKEHKKLINTDIKTVESFGNEWNYFNQNNKSDKNLKQVFQNYFSIFPFEKINQNSIGMDVGCGSGRWSYFIAPLVKTIYCIDPSKKSLEIAKKNLKNYNNCIFMNQSANTIDLKNNSIDFGYSLGVLHHVPDTLSALKNCIDKLKPGSPFLLYLYYNFENRNFVFRFIWLISNIIRIVVSRLPFFLKRIITDLIAISVYYPLSRISRFLKKFGIHSINLPLSFYHNKSFYMMRTDSLDRFGTKLEKRYSKKDIENLMKKSNLENITFLNSEPYWVALGYKIEK